MKTHYIYKITNHTTGEYYYGRRTCTCHWEYDTYMGSDEVLRRKMDEHPDHDWRKLVLLTFDNEDEACEYERVVVANRWRDDPLCLNSREVGSL